MVFIDLSLDLEPPPRDCKYVQSSPRWAGNISFLRCILSLRCCCTLVVNFCVQEINLYCSIFCFEIVHGNSQFTSYIVSWSVVTFWYLFLLGLAEKQKISKVLTSIFIQHYNVNKQSLSFFVGKEYKNNNSSNDVLNMLISSEQMKARDLSHLNKRETQLLLTPQVRKQCSGCKAVYLFLVLFSLCYQIF